jgi:AcrR family transcriptional regulator
MTENQDDTRQRVLHAAGQIFADKGYDATTVREICARAGANQAAVNYHFRDKENLYVEAVQHAHCVGMDETMPDWTARTPPSEKLRQFVEGMLSHLLDPSRPDWHAQLMMRELSHPTDACVKLVDAYIRPKADLLGSILAEMLPPGTPEREAHLVGFSVVGQCLFYRVHRPIARLLVGAEEFDSYSVQSLAEHITRFSLAAIEQYSSDFPEEARR